MHFYNGIDYFVGTVLQQNADTLFKSRLLVGVLFSFIFSVLCFAPFFVFVPNLPSSAVLVYIVSTLLLITCWMGLLHLIKQGKAFKLCAHISCASLLLVLFAGIAVTGGPFKTETHPLLVIPVIVSFLLLGKRAGLGWSIATIVGYFLLTGLSLLGIEYINLSPLDLLGFMRLFNWTYAFILASALIFIYETMNSRMMSERDKERQKLEHIANVAVEKSVVNESAAALAESGEALLSSAIHQKQSIEQLATTTEELGATADKNSHLAQDAMTAIKDTDQHIFVSREDLLELGVSMQEMKDSSKEIQSINNVINDISYQTNLLSLNAMIEASRSGDENSGFKVVALEVKKLAERSADAAADINDLLSKNFAAVQQGGQLASKIEQRFNEIAEKIGPLVDAIQQVSDASHEQNLAIHQITEGLIAIDKVIEENKNRAYRSSNAAKTLKENSAILVDLVMSLEN